MKIFHAVVDDCGVHVSGPESDFIYAIGFLAYSHWFGRYFSISCFAYMRH